MPGTSKLLGYVIAFNPVELGLVLHPSGRRCRKVCVWGRGVMDRIYCRASVIVLDHRWHGDQRNKNHLDVWSGTVSLKMWNLKSNLISSASSHNEVAGTRFTFLP